MILVRTIAVSLVFVAGGVDASAGASLAEGVTLFEAGKLDEAEKIFKRTLDSDPGDGEAAFYLGRVSFEKRKWDDAIDYFKKATEIAATSSEYFRWYGEANIAKLQTVSFLSKKKFANRAREAWIKAVDLDPANIDARESLAGYYMEAPSIVGGSDDKALEQIEAIIALDPAVGHREKGAFYVKKERWDDAAAEYQLLIDMDPAEPGGYYRLGMMYQSAKRWDDAFAELERTLELDPEYTPAMYQIGRTAVFAKENTDRAIECLEMYLEFEPQPREPSWSHAHWRLGMLYEIKGDRAAAKREYRTAVELDPDNKTAKKALRRL